MRVCIIGAGISGLMSIRRGREHDLECVCYELASDIGGQWLYSENSGINEYGLPVLSSIYPSLRANLPTLAMEFEGYQFTISGDSCYPDREDIIKYIRNFTDDFNLRPYIKFCHRVELVKRVQNYWEVTVQNLKANKSTADIFDAVIVATGHYSAPFIPDILGIDSFYGTTLHSHYYRRLDTFRDRTVVIIGGGTSALDVCYALGDVTNKTYFSQHHADLKELTYPENVVLKPDIKYVSNDRIHFADGSVEWADVIIFCTGYKYHYPFLDESCGVKVIDHKFVRRLYKMMINISQPSMAFLGIPMRSMFFSTSNLQVRVFMKVLLGIVQLPSKEKMMEEWATEIADKKKKGVPLGKYHWLGGETLTQTVMSYYRDLEEFAELPIIVPDVLIKIYHNNAKLRRKDYINFRDQKYTIIDEHAYRLEHKGEVKYG